MDFYFPTPELLKLSFMPTQDLKINDPTDFEKFVAIKFKESGYKVIMPSLNTQGYDIELHKDDECIAVQVKNHKAKCNLAQIQKFQDFLELPLASKFTSGWFVSGSGYSKPAFTHVITEQPSDLRLGTVLDNGRVHWEYGVEEDESTIVPPPPPSLIHPPLSSTKIKYLGVFTCKGGVGKTTVSAHLAGAFALMGYDVILLDLDPDRNLRKLFLQDPEDEDGDASLYVPSKQKNEQGATITVLNHDQWREQDYPEVKIVICDCSPVLTENPQYLVGKFDYCIIPTTLNPLGVSKNGDVIVRTFQHIRECNPKAEMFALINNYDSSQANVQRNEVLLSHLKKSLSKYTSTDAKCKFIDPDAAKVRSSKSLLYWGYHIVAGTKPQLAFQETAGKSYPRTDFLQLAEYLESHTDIDKMREQEWERN
jgi:chromosome partitioning protein